MVSSTDISSFYNTIYSNFNIEYLIFTIIIIRIYLKLTEPPDISSLRIKKNLIPLLSKEKLEGLIYYKVYKNKNSDRKEYTHGIVLLHSFYNSNKWEFIVESLLIRYPNAVIFIPDLIGFNRSKNALSNTSLSLDLYLEQLEFHIRLEQVHHLPIILCGIGMSATICCHASKYFGLRNLNIIKLLLIAPAGLPNLSTNIFSLSIVVARILYLHRIAGWFTNFISLFINGYSHYARQFAFGILCMNYGMDSNIITNFNIPVTVVWGTNDRIHDYSLSNFYEKNKCIILSVKDWDHKAVCNDFELLQLEKFDDIWSTSKTLSFKSQFITPVDKKEI